MGRFVGERGFEMVVVARKQKGVIARRNDEANCVSNNKLMIETQIASSLAMTRFVPRNDALRFAMTLLLRYIHCISIYVQRHHLAVVVYCAHEILDTAV